MVTGADLRGAARLAADATLGLTDLVEAVHSRIARASGLPGAAEPDRTRGITGLVYRSVRGVTRLVGSSADALLGLLAADIADAATPRPEREALLAALNGVLGDHLAASGNPLAIEMAFRRDGRPLPAAPAAPYDGDRLLVLVHGLCMHDGQWARDGHDHGAALARSAGYAPVYLHYNTGRHVSTNGQALAQQLEALLQRAPQPPRRLVLLGHSMGGLVARSAVHQAQRAGLAWPAVLTDLVCLGTPHHGAPLERAGHGVDVLLAATPFAGPFARLARVRSAGITDLRRGSLLERDWIGRDRFAKRTPPPLHVPLPAGVRCYAMAGTTGTQVGDVKDRLLGDGLVPLDSALGRHADPARTLAFPPERQWVGTGVNHLALLSDANAAAQLRAWLG